MLYSINNQQDAFDIADQTRKNVEALNIKHSGNSASESVTISMGLYIIEANINNQVEDNIRDCDEGDCGLDREILTQCD